MTENWIGTFYVSFIGFAYLYFYGSILVLFLTNKFRSESKKAVSYKLHTITTCVFCILVLSNLVSLFDMVGELHPLEKIMLISFSIALLISILVF